MKSEKILLEDISPFVRSYCARIPIIPENILAQALKKEDNAFAKARLLQNPNFNTEAINLFTSSANFLLEDFFVRRVASLDSRINFEIRQNLFKKILNNPDPKLNLEKLIHNWYN